MLIAIGKAPDFRRVALALADEAVGVSDKVFLSRKELMQCPYGHPFTTVDFALLLRGEQRKAASLCKHQFQIFFVVLIERFHHLSPANGSLGIRGVTVERIAYFPLLFRLIADKT